MQSWKQLEELKCQKKFTLERNPDYTAESYLRLLRTSSKMKRIYDVNPYVEVYQFRENLYCLHTENCDAGGSVYMHLIVGPERALLIDTAYGLGDTKALVEGLADGKPVDVVNTHHHCDHAYGNCRFDRVYCHRCDVPYLKSQNFHIWDYLFDEKGDGKWLSFDPKDLPVFKEYEIIPIENGHIFDLGEGYKIETVWLGGHTAGHCGFIDPQNRIFFCGDDITAGGCSAGMGPNPDDKDPNSHKYMNLTFFRDALTTVADKMDSFDFIFPQHGPLELNKNIVQSVLTSCNHTITHPENYDYTTNFPGLKGEPPVVRYNCYLSGGGVLSYRKTGLFPSKEE